MDFLEDIKAIIHHIRHELLRAGPQLLHVERLTEVRPDEHVILDDDELYSRSRATPLRTLE